VVYETDANEWDFAATVVKLLGKEKNFGVR